MRSLQPSTLRIGHRYRPSRLNGRYDAFTRALGRALGRPTVLPMPAAALKLLFGDMSELLLVSDRMVPKRLLEDGFEFRYPDLEGALTAIFHST